MPQSDVIGTGSTLVDPPRPRLLTPMPQSVHDVSVRLGTRVGHAYNLRKEDVEQEGREHAPLTKTRFHSEPPRVHPVVEPQACSRVIFKLTNDRDHLLWHEKIGQYSPEEGSINRVVCLGTVNKTYICPVCIYYTVKYNLLIFFILCDPLYDGRQNVGVELKYTRT